MRLPEPQEFLSSLPEGVRIELGRRRKAVKMSRILDEDRPAEGFLRDPFRQTVQKVRLPAPPYNTTSVKNCLTTRLFFV